MNAGHPNEGGGGGGEYKFQWKRRITGSGDEMCRRRIRAVTFTKGLFLQIQFLLINYFREKSPSQMFG